MAWQDPHTALERFLRYVRVDTESDAASETSPSTAKQFDLLRLLEAELREAGAAEVYLAPEGYLVATVPGTVPGDAPTICCCAHVDTTQDVSGAGVVPRVHDYRGGTIVIDAACGLALDAAEQPYLREHIGHRVVTASGGTLLGADDKAGVAAIMDAALYLLRHRDIAHAPLRLLFTTDEEIGAGVDGLDLGLVAADYAYTLDGGEAGTLEGETFSADGAVVRIAGVSAHPGYARGKMTSAVRAAAYLVEQLPLDRQSPESTDGREGFVHCVKSAAVAEHAELTFLLRDFETARLDAHYALLEEACAKTRERFPAATVSVERREQYRNMAEVLARHPAVLGNAHEAIRRVGLTPRESVIRGGTDGSRLSFMGLPCANVFTGMQMIHSQREWVGVRDLDLAAEVVVELVRVWGEGGKS